MKTLWLLCLLPLLCGCSVFLNDLLDFGSLTDADLAGQLFINEVSADHPENADWVELYNAADRPVNLSRFYLSDDPLEADKWQFPGGTAIAAGGFLVIGFADDGEELSTGFGLAPGTDQVLLMTPDLTTIIDQLATIPLSGSGSYGRSTDGGDSWQLFTTATPGASNAEEAGA